MLSTNEYLTGFFKYGMGSREPSHHSGLLIGNDIISGIEEIVFI